MSYSTKQMVPGFPGKEPVKGVDWLGIVERFDPASLEPRFMNEFIKRDPYSTCYKWEEQGLPYSPVDERMRHLRFNEMLEQAELEHAVEGYNNSCASGEDFSEQYDRCRDILSTLLRIKACLAYVRREYESLGEDGRQKQAEEYALWEKKRDQEYKEKEALYRKALKSDFSYGSFKASMHEKVIRIRKGVKGSNGRCLTQRQFAKYIEYPINKYLEAEKIDRWGRDWDEGESPVEDELLDKLIQRCHANPYWLFDEDCEASFASYEMDDEAVLYGDEPCVYAPPDVILRWIQEGKPRQTQWTEGML